MAGATSRMQQKTVIIDDLITSTFYDVRSKIVDNTFEITPFWEEMVNKSRIRARAPQGTHFEIPIRYGQTPGAIKYFGRGTEFGNVDEEHLTRLKFDIKNVGTSIVRYFTDEQANKGSAQIIDYANEKVETAEMSLADALSTDVLVQNGDANSLTALETLLPTDNTSGSLGGLVRSGNSFLQHNVTDATGTTFSTGIIDLMKTMFNNCSLLKHGSRFPDIILTTQAIYESYEALAEAMQTIDTANPGAASLGFGQMSFKGKKLMWDPEVPAGTMYFLNLDSLEFAYDPDVWFEMTPWKTAQNNLDRVAQILTRGDMLLTVPRKNGIIHSISV